METDIKNLAISYWRLEKWVTNAPVEKKLAATSSLRNIKKYLDENNIEVLDPTGQQYDIGMAVDVIHNDMTASDDSNPLITETLKPIIMQNGSVIMFGQVVIGKTVKTTTPELLSTIDDENSTVKSINADKKDEYTSIDKKYFTLGIAILTVFVIAIGLVGIKLFQIDSNVNKFGEKRNQSDITDFSKSKDFTELNNRIDSIIEALSNVESKEDLDNLKDKLGLISNELADLKESNNTESIINTLNELSIEIELLKEAINTRTNIGNVEFVRYIVKKGDTLSSICDANGINYYDYKEEIMRFNGIDNDDLIFIGQAIYIPKIN